MRSLRIFTGGTISRIGVVPELGEDHRRVKKDNIVVRLRIKKLVNYKVKIQHTKPEFTHVVSDQTEKTP